jgi:phage terminase large subunit-like protein
MAEVDKDLLALTNLVQQLDRRKSIYQLEYYKPYPYQVEFHNARGKGTDKPAQQRMLAAANQIGKTRCAAFEVAMHATGRYPDWWRGTRFLHAVDILVGSNTNETGREICQRELFGDPTDDKALGTGTIPIDCIGKIRNKAGVLNAFDTVRIKHTCGNWSKIYIRAYEQGFKKFMGVKYDVGWCDEEPPADIWSQMIRATFSRKTAILFCTLTPEEGMTEVVAQFMNDLKNGQALLTATWDDAPHMTTEVKEQRLAALRPHEREMRSKGIPLMGSGLIFMIPDDQLVIDPIEIPRHWPQIVGVDFGWDHPFGAVRLAWDRDQDCVYLTAEYAESRAIPAIHAAAINAWGDWVPVAWPHDGLNADKGSGTPLADQYRDAHVNMLPWKASNPPAVGQKEGEGGNSVEASLLEMVTRMETKRFKVFKTCTKWLKEKTMYHRDQNGKIVKQNDDVISASRYGVMMLRHARVRSVLPRGHQSQAVGMRNW